MKKLMIGASLAALLALPALAADQGASRPERAPTTRADVLAQTARRFAALDANKDGVVTQAEVDQARAAMRTRLAEQHKQRMDARFARLDTDKDGQLSKAEFDAGYTARREGPRVGTEDSRPRRVRRGGRLHRGGPGKAGRAGGFLARLDANKDGKVTLAEFQAGPLARFDRIDANKDGTITVAERRAAWQAARDARKAKRR